MQVTVELQNDLDIFKYFMVILLKDTKNGLSSWEKHVQMQTKSKLFKIIYNYRVR